MLSNRPHKKIIVLEKPSTFTYFSRFLYKFSVSMYFIASCHKGHKVHTYTQNVCIYTHTHIYKMEYYSAIKKNKIMQFAATRMALKIYTK